MVIRCKRRESSGGIIERERADVDYFHSFAKPRHIGMVIMELSRG